MLWTRKEMSRPRIIRLKRRSVLMGGVASVGALAFGCAASATTGASPDLGGPDDQPDSGFFFPDGGFADAQVDSGIPACGNRIELGRVSDFPLDSWSLVQAPGAPVIVGHDAGGMFAFSAICTHQGCVVNPPDSSGTTVCRCHGSMFDGSGAVVQGPAFFPLSHFEVVVCEQFVFVDPNSQVSATTRTPVA
jgi:nitrite reductase/ring-hydroxylating ferredoxin subunit